MPDSDLLQVPHGDRIAFLTELAERLHAYGTTAQRLEGALLGVAARLGVECEPWVNPTGMILTFRDPADLQAPDLTRVIRMPPGDTDLSRLARADRIAEDVVAGRMGVEKVTVQNLTVHAVDAERGLILVKGSVPGPKGALVVLRTAAKKGAKA